jgi:hypothetical protein
MVFVPYDDPRKLFRRYEDWECDKEGYPFIWPTISLWVRRYSNNECLDCGPAYRARGDILTVHHFNPCKADCRRTNLLSLCWPCHSLDHRDTRGYRSVRCPHCKDYFLGMGHLMRHIHGKHRDQIKQAS